MPLKPLRKFTTPAPVSARLAAGVNPLATETGLVAIDDLPEYKARHYLRVVWGEWPDISRYPVLHVIEDLTQSAQKETKL